MTLKLFELRDRATFVPICAFRCRPTRGPDVMQFRAEKYLLNRAGFDVQADDDHVIIGRLDCENPTCSQCTYDMHSHGNSRTFLYAHQYIEAHWDQLESGAVIDVEFILGETTVAKVSESVSHPEA